MDDRTTAAASLGPAGTTARGFRTDSGAPFLRPGVSTANDGGAVCPESGQEAGPRWPASPRGRGISGGSDAEDSSAHHAEVPLSRRAPAAVTQYARLQRVLRDDPRRWYCSGCLAAKLGLRPGVVMMLALRLESHRDFRRSYQECDRCGQSRLVSAFTGIVDRAGDADDHDPSTR